jgi:hypothetical protein
VLCTERTGGSGVGCGSCGACHRFDRDLHPDFHLLAPEKNRVSIGVDAVESLQQRLALKPVEGSAKAALVPSAEALTLQAQNALLKTLEEPPPRTALLLTAAAPRALLATVLSRCAVLRLPPPPPEEVLSEAVRLGGSEGTGAVLVASAAGDPAILEEAAAEGVAAAAPSLARAFSPGRGGRDPLEGVGEAAAWVRGRGGRLADQRRRLRMALRLLLALHRGPGGHPRPGLPEALQGPYDALSPPSRSRRLAALGTARERVERNVDPVGILEALAVACAGAGTGGPS